MHLTHFNTFHPPPPRKTYHSNGRTKRLKVLLVLCVKADGAAGVHAAEGHLFRRTTVERLPKDTGVTKKKKAMERISCTSHLN